MNAEAIVKSLLEAAPTQASSAPPTGPRKITGLRGRLSGLANYARGLAPYEPKDELQPVKPVKQKHDIEIPSGDEKDIRAPRKPRAPRQPGASPRPRQPRTRKPAPQPSPTNPPQKALALAGLKQDSLSGTVARGLIQDALERHRTERTRIKGGKTRGKFRMPKNWKVGHAIKA